MLSSIFDSARRSLNRPSLRASATSTSAAAIRPTRPADPSRSQSWHFYDRNVDDDGEDEGDEADFTDENHLDRVQRNATFVDHEGGNGADSEEEEEEEEEEEDDGEEDEEEEDVPLLPIFESSHLDALPVYSLTHAIRLLIVPRCETTLSWDQLRSPQISQFLVKPIQKEILESHFSKATIYALLANCLQFIKEGDLNPAIVGVSKTRALVCELLAVRLLKEYSTRELIDVLSYDFYPLQGLDEPVVQTSPSAASRKPQAARTSTLEVGIMASAKRMLAHPLVVQHLEAVWAGSIVFHHAADAAHRIPQRLPRRQQYGTITSGTTSGLLSENTVSAARALSSRLTTRRTVTLYDPRDASLFKLSRLRVPRYRHFTSTCSLAVFLALFVAVLLERSVQITPLEIVFWFWSAGFMLDEVVGFNEQGFSLYVMSIWNIIDLGILLLLVCFYALRLYGVLLLDAHKHHVADLAYDVLAANAIFLFPRLFSILDHYRYFSQLLIAFRMMAQDLAATFILILVSCSGFFVAFTLSFGNDTQDPGRVAYQLFQLLMGFTPTAWSLWDEYNVLGKTLLTLFLIITHFLVVTILITVLTNSFMAIVQNANDEHQFVFAVNTISMVKSDALFSYIAPSNLLGWLLTFLRYFIPFRRFVSINRTVIKVTHFPVLLAIFLYECLILRRVVEEPADLVERGRERRSVRSFDPIASGMFFSPREPRLREPSAATFHKGKALSDMFRSFDDGTLRKTEKGRKSRTSAAVNTWMQSMGPDGTASPPAEEDGAVVAKLERPRFGRKLLPRRFASGISIGTRSLAASDPEDFVGSEFPFPRRVKRGKSGLSVEVDDLPDQSDNYGDDELLTNDDATERITVGSDKDNQSLANQSSGDLLTAIRPPLAERQSSISFAAGSPVRWTPQLKRPSLSRPVTSRRVPTHRRNASIQTVLFNPAADDPGSSPVEVPESGQPTPAQSSMKNTLTSVVGSSDAATSSSPSANKAGKSRQQRLRSDKMPPTTPPRPVMPPRNAVQSTPNVRALLGFHNRRTPEGIFSSSPPVSSAPDHRSARSNERRAFHGSYPRDSPLALDLASDLGDNKAANAVGVSGMPESFATRMAFADRLRRMKSEERHDDDRRMSKLVLSRMGLIEQGFREVLKEVKEMKDQGQQPEARDKKKGRLRSGATTPGLRSGVNTPGRTALRRGIGSGSGSVSGSAGGTASPAAVQSQEQGDTSNGGPNLNNDWVDEGSFVDTKRGSSI